MYECIDKQLLLWLQVQAKIPFTPQRPIHPCYCTEISAENSVLKQHMTSQKTKVLSTSNNTKACHTIVINL